MIPKHFDEATLFSCKKSSEIPKMTCEVALVYNDLDTRRTPSSFVFLSNECQYTARFAVAVYASSVSQHSSFSFSSCSSSSSCSSRSCSSRSSSSRSCSSCSSSYQLSLHVLGQLLNYTFVCTTR